jgi:Flp pilus assembly protein TadB
MMKQRTGQGGSVASFIVIGVILFVGLVTAIYFLNQRGQQARKEQTVATSDNNKGTKQNATKTTVNKSTVNTPAQTKTTSQSKSQNLPTTGPELSVVEIIGIYSLAASVVAYVLSRRTLAHSL